MRYTTEEGGRLNNFAVEPKVYKTEPPTKEQQRNYVFLGIGAAVLISSIVYVAIAASNVG